MIAGAFGPETTTIRPRLAARLYAGAVEAIPMTTLDTSPIAPPLSPFSPGADRLGPATTGEVSVLMSASRLTFCVAALTARLRGDHKSANDGLRGLNR